MRQAAERGGQEWRERGQREPGIDEPLERGRAQTAGARERGRHRVRRRDRGEQRCIGEEGCEVLRDALCAAALREVVVDEGDGRVTRRLRRR